DPDRQRPTRAAPGGRAETGRLTNLNEHGTPPNFGGVLVVGLGQAFCGQLRKFQEGQPPLTSSARIASRWASASFLSSSSGRSCTRWGVVGDGDAALAETHAETMQKDVAA